MRRCYRISGKLVVDELIDADGTTLTHFFSAVLGRKARVSEEFRSTAPTSIRGGDCEDQIAERHGNSTSEPTDGQVAGNAQTVVGVEGCSIITREAALDNVDGIGCGGRTTLMFASRNYAVPRCDHHPPWPPRSQGGDGRAGLIPSRRCWFETRAFPRGSVRGQRRQSGAVISRTRSRKNTKM